MITFGCDRCGKTLRREEAWQITLIQKAYAADAAGEKVQGEICADCAEILLREMIYRDGEKKKSAEKATKKQKDVGPNIEGRCITVARKRMGLTMQELADKLYVSKKTLERWEIGQVKKIPWEELYKALPELKEIRENGCEKYCKTPKACLGGGKCEFSGR